MVSETVYSSAVPVLVPVVLPEAALTMPLVLAPFVAFCVMIGLQWSIKSKGTIGSVAAAVGVAVAISGVLGLCGWVAGRGIPFLGAVLTAVNPINLLAAAVQPGATIGSTLQQGAGARMSLVIGGILAAAGYAAIVFAMHSNMKRTFMMTVRKLAGTA
jgi:hypothetical protein